MRSPLSQAIFGACIMLVLVTAAVLGTKQSDVAFTLGVQPTTLVTPVKPKRPVCEKSVGLGEPFHTVSFFAGTNMKKGSELLVKVNSANKTVATGTLRPGYGDKQWQDVRLSTEVRADPFDVCLHNVGRRSVALFGGPDLAAPNSFLEVDGRGFHGDIALEFKGDKASRLSDVPDMLTRASRFNLAGPTLLAVVLVAVALIVPILLAAAFAASRAESDSSK